MISVGDILESPYDSTRVLVTKMQPFTVKCIYGMPESGWKVGEIESKFEVDAYTQNNWKIIPNFNKYYESSTKTV